MKTISAAHIQAVAGHRSKAEDADAARSVSIRLNVAKVALFFQAMLAIVIGTGVLRELVIGVTGTETVLKDLRHFTLDSERNLASWYESICMISAAALLAFNALLSRQNDRRNTAAWTVLAVIFVLMSIDEVVSFHEISVKPLRNAFGLTGIFYYSWVLLAAPMVVVLGLYLVPFMLRLPRPTAFSFFIAGAVFVGGALGTELICGYLATNGGLETVAYKTTAAAQECLEVLGMTLFVTALLRHIATVAPALRATVVARG
jgi:hypothetical protein